MIADIAFFLSGAFLGIVIGGVLTYRLMFKSCRQYTEQIAAIRFAQYLHDHGTIEVLTVPPPKTDWPKELEL